MERSPLTLMLMLVLCMAAGAWSQTLLDPISRACRGMVGGNQEEALSRNEYPAGGMLMVLASVPAGVKGFFKFYLCLDDDAGQEECLNKKSLPLADGSGDTFDLSKVAKAGSFEIPLTIPDDVTCDTCSVQWHVEVEDCGENAGCSLISQDSCFDVKIRQAKKEEKRLFGLIFGAVRAIGGGIKALVRRRG